MQKKGDTRAYLQYKNMVKEIQGTLWDKLRIKWSFWTPGVTQMVSWVDDDYRNKIKIVEQGGL